MVVRESPTAQIGQTLERRNIRSLYNRSECEKDATGNEASDYLVVGPDWKGETPSGIKKVFRSTTQFSLAGYRTQLFNPDDMPKVMKIQAGYKVQPFSRYLNQSVPPAAPAVCFPKINAENGQQQVL
jgi:hypothetical protein